MPLRYVGMDICSEIERPLNDWFLKAKKKEATLLGNDFALRLITEEWECEETDGYAKDVEYFRLFLPRASLYSLIDILS